MSSLKEPRAKLERARYHLKLFYEELRAFLKREPYTVTVERDSNQLPQGFRIKITEHPPRSWGLMIGDYVHNLRSSLDHLVWQLSLDNCSDPGRALEFPIHETQPKRGETIRKKLKCVNPEARTIIKALQPYHSGDRARDHKLWTLNLLDIIDKHRRLNVVAYQMIMKARLGPEVFTFPPFGGNFYDGQVIPLHLGVVFDGLPPGVPPPHLEIDAKAEPALAIVVDYEGSTRPLEIYPKPNLSDLHKWIEQCVFDPLRPFFTDASPE